MSFLTNAERERFATYLEQDAESSEHLAEQALKLGVAGEAVAKTLAIEAEAERIVARKLRTIHESYASG